MHMFRELRGIHAITGRMPKYPVDNGSSSVELTDVTSRRLLASYYSRPPATSKHESTYLSLRDEFWTCHRNLLFSPTRKTNSLFNFKLVGIIATHYDVRQVSVEIFSTRYRVQAENDIYLAHGVCPVRNLVYLRLSNDCHIDGDRMRDLIKPSFCSRNRIIRRKGRGGGGGECIARQ